MTPVPTTSIPATLLCDNSTGSRATCNDDNNRIASDRIVIRENGTRHAGCDESSGWIWYAARQLEAVLALELWSTSARTAATTAAATTAIASNTQNPSTIATPRILELGSGTGWLSLHMARRGAVVTATERPGAMALLTQNVMRNQEQVEMQQHLSPTDGTSSDTKVSHVSNATTTTTTLQVDVQELEWSSPQRLEGDWDWIVGTDLLYIHENYIPLLQTIRRHCTSHHGHNHHHPHPPPSTVCVLSWEERKPHEEATFLQLAKDQGFQIIAMLPLGTNPATDNPVWILRMTYNHANNDIITDHALPPPQ